MFLVDQLIPFCKVLMYHPGQGELGLDFCIEHPKANLQGDLASLVWYPLSFALLCFQIFDLPWLEFKFFSGRQFLFLQLSFYS